MVLPKSQDNHVTKQNPWHVLLQMGTRQWQPDNKDNFQVEFVFFLNIYKDYYIRKMVFRIIL